MNFLNRLSKLVINNNNRRTATSLFQLAYYNNVPRIVERVSFNNYRFFNSARINSVIVFVPQQEAWVIERMGKFDRILGISFLNVFKFY